MKGKILTYKDLAKIKAGENKENLVSLNKLSSDIICVYQKKDMLDYVGDEIFVREKVAQMLIEASKTLKKKNVDYSLKIVYGYRHPEVQQKYFDNRKAELALKYKDVQGEDLIAKTHLFVASPDVAGHIVGGAVDVTISDLEGDLDMGTNIADYSDEEKIQTFYESISQAQKQNRKLLHDTMVEVGFSPFYGEWWHFSYGDKEWAAFYKFPQSLYSPIYFEK